MNDGPPTTEQIIAFLEEREPRTVLHALGIRVVDWNPDALAVEVDVTERLYQHAGFVHGGVYVLLAETAASLAAAFTTDVGRNRIAGQEISASHIRSATTGKLRATARSVHRGQSSHVYNIDVDNDGRLVSTCRCTIAVRPL